jgi:hypothetical protein
MLSISVAELAATGSVAISRFQTFDAGKSVQAAGAGVGVVVGFGVGAAVGFGVGTAVGGGVGWAVGGGVGAGVGCSVTSGVGSAPGLGLVSAATTGDAADEVGSVEVSPAVGRVDWSAVPSCLAGELAMMTSRASVTPSSAVMPANHWPSRFVTQLSPVELLVFSVGGPGGAVNGSIVRGSPDR